ncbi:MAG: hypothetical protein KAV87_29885, partial [Desulfobacteraceae bacterium]|nr:hypothetical protein [Desulfobacteraceae bacterium]
TLDINGEVTSFEAGKNLTYTLQHKAILNGSHASVCTFEQGIDVLKLIDAAELASEKQVWIDRTALDSTQ